MPAWAGKLVDAFERNAASFVSIAQHFNTTTSTGWLTLNILLSFAQLERKVIGERSRDKFAASRRKGMWMGGIPPLGYDVVNRKLVVSEAESGVSQGSGARGRFVPGRARRDRIASLWDRVLAIVGEKAAISGLSGSDLGSRRILALA